MITFLEYRFAISEAVYPGNVGMMELLKFFSSAEPDNINHVKQLIKDQKHSEAWEEIQKHTGVKLDQSGIKEV